MLLKCCCGWLIAQTGQIQFSQHHGIQHQSFQLEITTPVADATIYYTSDGSLPSAANGIVYTQPIAINTTTVMRAVVVSPWVTNAQVVTASYLFPSDVIRQTNSPTGYPDQWGPYTAISGKAIADYEMDQDLLSNQNYANAVISALSEIPTISIVTDRNHLFSDSTDPENGGIYIYTGAPITNFTYALGRGWERPASVEYFDTNQQSFQINCGLRIQGGHGRRPEKSPKHSLLLNFDSQYGPDRVSYPFFGEKSAPFYKKLILRAGFGNSWVHHDNAQRIRASYIEDIWTKDTQRAMGHPASKSNIVHLYINGIYWGLYAPSERMDKDFGEIYLGGDDDDYDVIKDYTEVANGQIDAWNEMMNMANAGLQSTEKYKLIQGLNPDGTDHPTQEPLVDVVNLADYMLINFYGANSDWDHHNWAAMRNRVSPRKGFTFMCWDGESMLTNINGNILTKNNSNCPSNIYQQLLKNAEFKRLLANRIQKHLFNDGALTPDSAIARWQRRKVILENPILVEAARWGDYRRDVHRYQTSGPFDLYTKDGHWTPRNNYLLETYFPQRTAIFLSHLRSAGLFPSVDAPDFRINGKVQFPPVVNKGDVLSFTASQGNIYYTADGTDPMNMTTGFLNSAKAQLYTQAIPLQHSGVFVARTYYNGQWSAAITRSIVIPENRNDIKITEIQYQPLDATLPNSEYEFLEIKNAGTATLDLSGFSFTKGVSYTFPAETYMQPGTFKVLASNGSAFFSRYGFRPCGEYSGKLDNKGEMLVFESATADTIFAFSYQRGGEWPAASGTGYSMVASVVNPTGNPADASYWRTSAAIGGSPGSDDGMSTSVRIFNQSPQAKIMAVPNPFSDLARISYSLPESAHVSIALYNSTGQLVTSLINQAHSQGQYQINWDGHSHNGQAMPDGLYLIRMQVNISGIIHQQTIKIILSR